MRHQGTFVVRCLATATLTVLMTVPSARAQLSADNSKVWTLEALDLGVETITEDRFGPVASGDFDADGLDDLAIGFPGHPLTSYGSGGGVAVLFGSRPTLDGCCGARVFIDQDVPGAIDEVEDVDRFGSAVATGDFNGDGFDDLAVGVPGEDIVDFADAGAVQVFYGPDFLTDNELWSLGVLGRGLQEGDNFGDRLEVGDFDGNGYDDLAVGVPARDLSGSSNAGAVQLIYGSEFGLRPQGNQYWTLHDVGVVGPEWISGLGVSLAAGDFDGDGFDDLAMTGRETIDPFGRIGHVYVLYGLGIGLATAGQQTWTEDSLGIGGRSPSRYANFGTDLVAADFNGDGWDDLGVGAYSTDIAGGDLPGSGALYALYGADSGLVTAGSQFWHQDSPGMLGKPAVSDFFAADLSRGDFNSDGFDDVAISIGGKDIDGAGAAGAVQIIYGSQDGLSSAGNQLWHQNSPGIQEVAETDDRFGGGGGTAATLTAGDFNGNGADDLAIGVPLENLDVSNGGLVHVLYQTFEIFTDGFESGNSEKWSSTTP